MAEQPYPDRSVSEQSGQFRIDQHDGTIELPNHELIHAHLSQDALRHIPGIEDLRSWDCGTLPWIHFQFSGGLFDGEKLQVRLCFYGQALVYAELFLVSPEDEYPPFDLESQIKQKERYDELLVRMLGKPTSGATFWFGRIRKGEDAMKHALAWRYPWGTVGSHYDGKGEWVYMHISYGNRHEEFNKAYRARASATRR